MKDTNMSVQRLVSAGSEPLSRDMPPRGNELSAFTESRSLCDELSDLLIQKNGFYAFESALHIFPATQGEGRGTLKWWNSPNLWRQEYGILARDSFYFAEDAFGNQFCFLSGQVCTFDAETGDIEALGTTMSEWADRVLADYDVLTGYSLLHRWQRKHGALPHGQRLIPKKPFVLGGAFTLENLYALDSVSGMRSRGNLARQIVDLPDGGSVELKVVP